MQYTIAFYSPYLGLFVVIGRGRSASVKFYNEWIDEVKRTVPKERLLIYNVDEGWKPLCDFLNVPIPDDSFPYIDDTPELRKSQQNLKLISYFTMFSLPVFVSLLLAYFYNYRIQNN